MEHWDQDISNKYPYIYSRSWDDQLPEGLGIGKPLFFPQLSEAFSHPGT
jgi:hypothetical protein